MKRTKGHQHDREYAEDRIMYKLYGCGKEYVTESELKRRFYMNLANNPLNGWACEYANFADYIKKISII